MDFVLLDQYLQGSASAAYYALGAHFTHEFDQDGVRFTVHAPHAQRVDVVGTFNGWSGYAMERYAGGIWSIFVRDVPEDALYKYRIYTEDACFDKADPFAFYSELRPATASIVCRLEGYAWQDGAWMASRDKNFNRPVNIYEVHLGSWKRSGERGPCPFLNYRQLAEELIPYAKEMGYTHLELLPLTEYPYDGSWGYQAAGYFSATSRYGKPKELMAFIDQCHQAGLGVILDFVAAHFVRDAHGLACFDGQPLFESASPELRDSPWNTSYFDFTKPHVQSFLKSSADFWLTFFHFDGIRFDAVSHLTYHRGEEGAMNHYEAGIWFLKSVNYFLANKFPGVMLIAEDSSSFLKVTAPVVYGGLGFDYKWTLNWMHDLLDFFALSPMRRGDFDHIQKLTSNTSYFYTENLLLPLSHDEVVHLKKPNLEKIFGDEEAQMAQLRTLYLYFMAHPGKKLDFMGNELAQTKEWDENKPLQWELLKKPPHKKFQHFRRALSELYRSCPPLYEQDYHASQFQWLIQGENGIFAFVRQDSSGNETYCVFNMLDRAGKAFLPVKAPARYASLICSDAKEFGGGGTIMKPAEIKGRTLTLTLAPYASCLIARE